MQCEENYTIWFEFFGKRMKTIVKAKSKEDAMLIVRKRINILKVEREIPDDINNHTFKEVLEAFEEIFGSKFWNGRK